MNKDKSPTSRPLMKVKKLKRRFAQSIVDRAIEEIGGIEVGLEEIYGPTEAPPGSLWKIEVMRKRLAAGVLLHHPQDVKLGEKEIIYQYVLQTRAGKELVE